MTDRLTAPAGANPARPVGTPARWAVACVLALGAWHGRAPAASPAPKENPRLLAAQVRALFAAKCAECHGAGVARPGGGFGYVLDLRRVANKPDLVIPHKPSGSRLWQLVRNGDMPPEHATAGPLTA